MLPNFLILGGPRCGSTWLASTLNQHPQAYVARLGFEYATGDIHFFDSSKSEGQKNYGMGIEWYSSLFANAAGAIRIGEKTADYLADPQAPQLIKNTVGNDIRLIACLRDPVTRAFSHYWHERPNLPLSMSFESAFFNSEVNKTIWLQNSGFYYANISRYRRIFKPENMLLLFNEQMQRSPVEHLYRVCEFLEIDTEFQFSNPAALINKNVVNGPMYYISLGAGWLRRHTPGIFDLLRRSTLTHHVQEQYRKARNIPSLQNKSNKMENFGHHRQPKKLDNSLRDKLRDFYRDDVIRLSSLVGCDMQEFWWKENNQNE